MMKRYLAITHGMIKTHIILVNYTLTKLDKESPTRLGCTTCTAMFMNGATIITERITTSSRPKRIQRDQRPALPVFCGVDRGTSTRVSLVPLAAVGTTLIAVTPTSAGFGWFVSWISSVVIHPPAPAHVFVVPTPPPGRRARESEGSDSSGLRGLSPGVLIAGRNGTQKQHAPETLPVLLLMKFKGLASICRNLYREKAIL
jgi:hypothetical protein